MDIVLTTSETKFDLTNFKNDLHKELASKGVNIENVNIESIERNFLSTETTSASNIFSDWNCFNVYNYNYYKSTDLNNDINGGVSSPNHYIINKTLNAVESNYNLYDSTGKIEAASGFYNPNGFAIVVSCEYGKGLYTVPVNHTSPEFLSLIINI